MRLVRSKRLYLNKNMEKTNSALMANSDAERQVLGEVLRDENVQAAILPTLTPDLFTDEACKKCYAIILQMQREGKIPEMIGVGMRLSEQGETIAPFLVDGAPSLNLTCQQVDVLKELALKRSLYKLGVEAQRIATSPTAEVEAFRKLLADFNNVVRDDDNAISIGEALHEVCNNVALRMQGKGTTGIMTGLQLFDARMGFHGGDLVIIAAETSQGKTVLASTIAYNMATNGIPVAYYSLEMGASQLAARMVARPSGISSGRSLYDPHFTENEFANLHDASLALAKAPIFFDERSKTTFAKIVGSIRTLVRKQGIKVAIVDYLQILANGKEENREAIVGDMARDLKNLATELGICVIALSQLSRNGNDHKPSLSRLRASGQIGEAADMVIGIYRPEVFGIKNYNNMPIQGKAEISILKNRNGSLGESIVSFDGELTYFSDLTGPLPDEKEANPWDD